jgi:hypothetical protein
MVMIVLHGGWIPTPKPSTDAYYTFNILLVLITMYCQRQDSETM